jgi:hypothetical protein
MGSIAAGRDGATGDGVTVSVGSAVAEGVSVGVPVWVGDDVGEGVSVGDGAGVVVGSASFTTFAGAVMATSSSPAPSTIFADTLYAPLDVIMTTCCHIPALSASVIPATVLAPFSPATTTCTSVPGSAVPVINRVPGSVTGRDGCPAEIVAVF